MTRALLVQIPESRRETLEQAMCTWWVNLRKQGGLRLTDHGFEILRDELELEHWTLPFAMGQHDLGRRRFLNLDRALIWPYYLEITARKQFISLVCFNSKEAMTAALYGDVDQWLDHVMRD